MIIVPSIQLVDSIMTLNDQLQDLIEILELIKNFVILFYQMLMAHAIIYSETLNSISIIHNIDNVASVAIMHMDANLMIGTG